jgi:hypothetical protein
MANMLNGDRDLERLATALPPDAGDDDDDGEVPSDSDASALVAGDRDALGRYSAQRHHR